jgi:hypothetical protein
VKCIIDKQVVLSGPSSSIAVADRKSSGSSRSLSSSELLITFTIPRFSRRSKPGALLESLSGSELRGARHLRAAIRQIAIAIEKNERERHAV